MSCVGLEYRQVEKTETKFLCMNYQYNLPMSKDNDVLFGQICIVEFCRFIVSTWTSTKKLDPT